MKKTVALIITLISVAFSVNSVFANELVMNEPVVDGAEVSYSGKLVDGLTNYVSFYVTKDDGKYYYIGKTQANDETGEFSGIFNMSDTAPSGEFEIVFSGVKMAEGKSKKFTYYSKSERENLIAAITDSSKTKTEIVNLITEPENVKILNSMLCDTEGFLGLGDYQEVAADIIKGRQNGYYDASFTEEEFKALFNFTVAYTATVKVPNADIAEKLTKYKDVFSIDIEGLKNSTYLSTKIRAIPVGKPEDFVNTYNSARAVIAVNDEVDYKNVPNILNKHVAVFNINLTEYTKLTSYKMSEVYQDLISRDYDTPDVVVSTFNSKYNELCNKKESSSSPAGGGGGGGGGGGFTTPPEMTVQKPAEVKATVFNDITGYDWAKEAIETLCKYNVIDGIGDNQFAPSALVKREQFVKMIVAAFSLANSSAECEFDDVKSNEWYYMYIASAVNAGIINGVSDMSFGTGENITREDMAVILYRVIDSASLNIPSGNTKEFSDEGMVADYAKKAVDALSSSGIINGREDGSFGAKDFATRAEAAKIIYEVWKLKY